ncbi:MAG: alpha/beta hydrolase [Spirochaetaceae bacterium]|jgi:pimeloyl-ACP methyl ester carboxylesterase|nr:alpha/beta hydrolase [Spirochaetaceae bacterium]
MDTFFKLWPSLEIYAKLFPSKRFPGLFYYDYDPQSASRPGKPVLILIHGLGDEADSWRHLIPLLGAAGYRMLAPDLPGFGRSPVSRYSSLGRHRDAVLELAEAVSGAGSEQGIVLIGSSMGAAVAEAAALARASPAPASSVSASPAPAIKALVLLDGCIPAKYPGSAQILVAALPFTGEKWYRSFRNNPQKAWQSLTSYYADINSLPEADKEFLRSRVMDRVSSLSQERGYFSSLRSMIFQSLRSSYYRRIGDWPGKIALIWGKEDLMMPRSVAESFIKLRGEKTTELTLIPGAGHLPHQERPAETAQAILAFLREV